MVELLPLPELDPPFDPEEEPPLEELPPLEEPPIPPLALPPEEPLPGDCCRLLSESEELGGQLVLLPAPWSVPIPGVLPDDDPPLPLPPPEEV